MTLWPNEATWLVTGSSGNVGSHLVFYVLSAYPSAKLVLPVRGHRRPLIPQAAEDRVTFVDCGAGGRSAVVGAVTESMPNIVIHLAAVTSIAEAAENPSNATLTNIVWTEQLARAAEACGARFVYASTDMVFAGDKRQPPRGASNSHSDAEVGAFYNEDDPARPLSFYGRTKFEGELRTLRAAPSGGVIVRLPLMYGVAMRPLATAEADPIAAQAAAFQAAAAGDRGPVMAFEDEYRTPLSYATAAEGIAAIVAALGPPPSSATPDEVDVAASTRRVYHLASRWRVSRLQLLREFLRVVVNIAAMSTIPDYAERGGDELQEPPVTAPVSHSHVDPTREDGSTAASSSSEIPNLATGEGVKREESTDGVFESVARRALRGTSQADYNRTASEPRPADLSLRCAALERLLGQDRCELLVGRPHMQQWLQMYFLSASLPTVTEP